MKLHKEQVHVLDKFTKRNCFVRKSAYNNQIFVKSSYSATKRFGYLR